MQRAFAECLVMRPSQCLSINGDSFSRKLKLQLFDPPPKALLEFGGIQSREDASECVMRGDSMRQR